MIEFEGRTPRITSKLVNKVAYQMPNSLMELPDLDATKIEVVVSDVSMPRSPSGVRLHEGLAYRKRSHAGAGGVREWRS